MPLLPLHDANPRRYIRAHYVTIALIAANLLIFLPVSGLGEDGLYRALLGYGVVPVRLFEDVALPDGVAGVSSWLTLLTYQFLHGSWEHVIFNMLFLWVFGDNLEDAFGHLRFLGAYLLCGVVGGLVHAVIQPDSATLVVGASGAVSGVLGGYLVLYPRARLLVLAFFIIPVRLPALLVIGTFFAQDLLWALTNSPTAMSIAVWAHIGGFATGAFLAWRYRRRNIATGIRDAGPWG